MILPERVLGNRGGELNFPMGRRWTRDRSARERQIIDHAVGSNQRRIGHIPTQRHQQRVNERHTGPDLIGPQRRAMCPYALLQRFNYAGLVHPTA